MKRIWIFLYLLFLCFSSVSQVKTFSSDYVYIINNQNFENIINDFIEHEKQYDYFDSTSIFQMQIVKTDSSITFFLMSGFRPLEMLDWTFWNAINDKYFIIKYHDYYFRLYSRDGEKELDTNLMIKKNEGFELNVKEKIGSKGESVGIGSFEDDTYMETTWIYVYQNEKFYEISRFARNYGRIKW